MDCGELRDRLALESVRSEIAAGCVVFLLDGLDELGEEREEKYETKKWNSETGKQETVIETRQYDPRKRLMDSIPSRDQIIVTCRVKDYTEIGKSSP